MFVWGKYIWIIINYKGKNYKEKTDVGKKWIFHLVTDNEENEFFILWLKVVPHTGKEIISQLVKWMYSSVWLGQK